MPSTVIRRFSYDPQAQELDVTFTTGRRYLYHGVPQAAADDFRAAFSKGRHFNFYIRDAYDYTECVARGARPGRPFFICGRATAVFEGAVHHKPPLNAR